ncbi:hypothetical protein PQ455_03400 [Sphingomonas naphthae]|uniref:VOC domain-containing protein n=1 Tax=Sphingomonas naphthae TaxID=1813468 RepID=A0ABY7TM29_9SPHN|nr:hypothetical protein [Sphingomonas naphthae]WCT74287.1 hypothetical protein PQ455_03400 [Sphingomonas naphthae]
MLFEEYANHRVASLAKEAGEGLVCYYREGGLPEKIIDFPDFNGEGLSDPPIPMRLIAPGGGNHCDAYLQKLGLVPGEDYERHGNHQRSGLLYFDILRSSAVEVLFARAEAASKASSHTERLDQARQSPSYRSPR